ncbi:AAA family ATPase [Exiguobacterium antarcticum]|uniref:AAA family ATPase n=1 Tax=Exiguobacterium antarcticum TaxID=132920 RepID=A0ABT6R1G2_9BACL|nr:AAA family ATPase [Exiguobacterium antarcticum]MDI3234774.1 AAA family ATPase [Exiguobacterium antarcticum]
MIIWINGTFGVGKTTAARGLQKRIKGSHLFDPELTGQLLRRQLPQENRIDDFQDEPLWRRLNLLLLEQLDQTATVVIVPMTLTNPDYFEEIVGILRTKGHQVRHVTLMASPETVRRRLRSRFERGQSWGGKQVETRLRELKHPFFLNHVDTDGMSKHQIVDVIGLLCDIRLLPPRRPRQD